MSEQSSPNIKPYTWVSRMEGARTKVKRGFTLIEFLVSLGIVTTIAGLLIPALLAAMAKVNRKPEEVRQERDKSWHLHTQKHDGHMWILNRTMDYFVHHPDCPCHGKAEKEE
jgi:prepilin-type N-terminal cleavage/methylation domain-containing protein